MRKRLLTVADRQGDQLEVDYYPGASRPVMVTCVPKEQDNAAIVLLSRAEVVNLIVALAAAIANEEEV